MLLAESIILCKELIYLICLSYAAADQLGSYVGKILYTRSQMKSGSVSNFKFLKCILNLQKKCKTCTIVQINRHRM